GGPGWAQRGARSCGCPWGADCQPCGPVGCGPGCCQPCGPVCGPVCGPGCCQPCGPVGCEPACGQPWLPGPYGPPCSLIDVSSLRSSLSRDLLSRTAARHDCLSCTLSA